MTDIKRTIVITPLRPIEEHDPRTISETIDERENCIEYTVRVGTEVVLSDHERAVLEHALLALSAALQKGSSFSRMLRVITDESLRVQDWNDIEVVVENPS
jgi:hypothetical protein